MADGSNTTTPPTKVVNKDYLYIQFQRYYEQVGRPDIEAIETELVKITRKLNKVVEICEENNIHIDFSDIDDPSSEES